MGFFDGFKKFREEKGSSPKHTRYEPTKSDELIESDWSQIDVLVSQRGPSQLRQALLTAHKSFDHALKNTVNGENIPERLKAVRDRFDPGTYDKLWKAHKMRNALVHESGYEPPAHMVTDAIETLRKGVQGLGVKV